MSKHYLQTDYWDKVYETKHFTHQIHESMYRILSSSLNLLDYGCGTGRIIESLIQHSKASIIGIESSKNMLNEAMKKFKHNNSVTLIHNANIDVPEVKSSSIDVAFLFAVLTCTRYDKDQRLLVNELYRMLKPSGFLYVSDYLIQEDQFNQERYSKDIIDQNYGVFKTSDGGIMRHHVKDYFLALFDGLFTIKWIKSISGTTMNGNNTVITQILLEKI